MAISDPEVRARIKALVEKQTLSDKAKGYPGKMCALARAQAAEPADWDESLSDAGIRFGLTRAEAWGVMSGWDACYVGREDREYDHRRDHPIYGKLDRAEYDSGLVFGRELCEQFGR